MNRHRCLVVLFMASVFSLPAYAHHLAVIVPKVSATASVTSEDLAKIMKSELRKWPDGTTIVIVMTRNSAPSLQVVERLCHLSSAAVKDLIANRSDVFVLADSDASALKIVESTAGALGLVDVHAISGTHVRVVKVDGKLPMELGYLPH
jgi:hypothetical protein